ncbi:sulfotransferase family protein [Aliiroseovarius sp. YM-037]|uniref:sulfotransferase family protein n=1 Tax=Aliiroseovarius sp. YM-037 TaxID=3341728 RepID=UPI003A7F9F1D
MNSPSRDWDSQRIAQPDGSLDLAPIFVFGSERSGSTLFALMLDAHPAVSNPGEVDFLFDYLERDPAHPTGWRYDMNDLAADRIFIAKSLTVPEGMTGLDLLNSFLDQLEARSEGLTTHNLHRRIDRLLEIFPNARIIHILRDPRDVARSSIGIGWAGTVYHGINHWIECESTWEKIADQIAPEQVLTLRYEALIANPERELDAVCAFLGVSYDDRMLEYHRNSGYEKPDPSLAGQWRHKQSPQEVALVEGKIGTLMKRRGYEPSGEGIQPGFWLRLKLTVIDKLAIWRFSVRRYGFVPYAGEKVARRLGLHELRRHFQKKIDQRVKKYLK